MANLYLDICLSDIPKERIKEAANGKKYLKAIIRPRQEVDRDGYDHYIAAWIPKEERAQGDRPAFIGRAELKKEENHVGGTDFRRNDDQPKDNNGDLPFDPRPEHRR